MTWVPSGASAGSERVGIVASRYGCPEIRPYFESLNALSRWSRLGAMTIRPAQALVVDADERRQGVQDEGHLRDHAGHSDVLGTPTQGRTDLGRVEKAQEGVLGVGARSDDARVDLLAAREGDAFHGASPGADGRDVDTASHRRAVAFVRQRGAPRSDSSGPPRAKTVRPAAPPPEAESHRKLSAVPADRGPMAE